MGTASQPRRAFKLHSLFAIAAIAVAVIIIAVGIGVGVGFLRSGGQPALPPAPSVTPSSSSTPAVSPAPSGPNSAYGVFVDGKASGYSVLLIRSDGTVAARADATMPAVYSFVDRPLAPPLVSITGSRVYYANGSDIKFLRPDGSTGVAATYPGGPKTVAAFSVSPDDRRIAVALLTFNDAATSQAALKLYVEDVGGGNRVELFSSSTVTEWPVAWVNGELVIAVGPAVIAKTPTNPYGGTKGYHVIDATTGNRIVTMSDDCLYGPLVAAGSACLSDGTIAAQAFDGTIRDFGPSGGPQLSLALLPQGWAIAGRPGADGAEMVSYVNYMDQFGPRALHHTGVPVGWIDELHLVYYEPAGFSRGIVDFTVGSVPGVTPVPSCGCDGPGVFFGAFTPVA